MTVVLLSAVAAVAPARSGYPFVPVTPTEKKQTRPLAVIALGTKTTGESWRLCDLLSARWLREEGMTRARCRTQARRHPAPSCKTCTYSKWVALGAYPTAAARRQGRKTVVWIVAVKGDPHFSGASEVELRFIREADRWRLDYWLEAGSGR